MGRFTIPVEVEAPSAEEAREGLHQVIDASRPTATFVVADVAEPKRTEDSVGDAGDLGDQIRGVRMEIRVAEHIVSEIEEGRRDADPVSLRQVERCLEEIARKVATAKAHLARGLPRGGGSSAR